MAVRRRVGILWVEKLEGTTMLAAFEVCLKASMPTTGSILDGGMRKRFASSFVFRTSHGQPWQRAGIR